MNPACKNCNQGRHSTHLSDSNPRVHRHLTRLHALLEMGIDAAPKDQIRKIVDDSTSVLDFAYGELSISCEDGESVTRLCSVGAENLDADAGPIGWRALRASAPLMITNPQRDAVGAEPIVEGLGLRALLFWPFAAESRKCVLTLGWQHTRKEEIGEDEISYLNFLTALISRLLAAAERHKQLADRINKDPLTGLYNRAGLFDHLAQAISFAQRSNGNVAVFYLDLNNFKAVNDTHGHATGDAALAQIAARLQGVLRRHEIAGRIGGDEFAVIVSKFGDWADLQGIAKRVLDEIGRPFAVGDIQLETSASLGIACYPADAGTLDELIAAADRAMYGAKAGGANTAVFAGGGRTDALRLDAANFDKTVVLCFQPIVSARGRQTIGAEVLARWLHPQHGLLPPRRLLEAATQQKLLGELERQVLGASCRKANAFAHRLASITLHVNVLQADPALLESTPAGAGIAFEFAEEQIQNDPERFGAFMAECRAQGFRTGLTGFGSGNLSLRALAQLPLDFVKIRGDGLRGADSHARASKALKMLIDHAHFMSCQVIAEAVETEEEVEWLVRNDVDALQGYAISSPMTDEDFVNWARSRALRAV